MGGRWEGRRGGEERSMLAEFQGRKVRALMAWREK